MYIYGNIYLENTVLLSAPPRKHHIPATHKWCKEAQYLKTSDLTPPEKNWAENDNQGRVCVDVFAYVIGDMRASAGGSPGGGTSRAQSPL